MVLVLPIRFALAAVAAVLARPLRAAAYEADSFTSQDIEEARLAKCRELREVELDWRTGRLSEADSQLIRAQLRAEAATVLRAERDDRDLASSAAGAPASSNVDG